MSVGAVPSHQQCLRADWTNWHGATCVSHATGGLYGFRLFTALISVINMV